ncbi:MAG TPA: hypothetical protein VH601_14120 [Bryobacteraceae bacterium]
MTIPDLDTPSARLWDFAAASDRLYFLVADRKASTYELCISDAKGNLEQRISLPTKEGYASGKVRVSRRGVVAVLFRGHGNSEVTVLAKEGNLISDTNLDKYILEIAFTGDKLVGASWEGLVSLNQFLGESMGESLSITRELSYPFALLPLPSGSLGVFDYLGGTFLSISNGAVDNARVFQIPELLERPKELAAEGAALVIDSTVDDTGNYYLALPNFKPSMYARVLKLDSRAQRVGVMQFPMAHHPDTGRYVHPRLIRVDSGKVFIACLRSNQLLVCSF